MTSNATCNHCGFELGQMVGRNGEPLDPTFIVCEKCDLMPQMVQEMDEQERMEHQKEVTRWITQQR